MTTLHHGLPLNDPHETLAHFTALRDGNHDSRPAIGRLVSEFYHQRQELARLRDVQQKLREQFEALTAMEHHHAVITGIRQNGRLTVDVMVNNARIEVDVHPDVPADRLRVGAQGRVTRERNCLVKVYDDPNPDWSDLGEFQSWSSADRLIVRFQGESRVLTAAETLRATPLRRGDLIGFDHGSRIAYERVEPPDEDNLFLEQTPNDRFEELGGLDRVIARLKSIMTFRFRYPDVADRYRVPRKRGIILVGPPGNGKTKLARCCARWSADLNPSGTCRFMTITGSEDYSMWLGGSEARLRARFKAIRQAARESDSPILLFIDEIDAIGRRRGSDFGSGAPDRILATFLAEMDGIAELDNVLILAACNRPDVLDPALLRHGRLGETITIPAPNRTAARAILDRYLGDGRPLDGDRHQIVECLLSRLYSPTGEYAELARVVLRDARKVAVGAPDLISGAFLEGIVGIASQAAADREIQFGTKGIALDDLAQALDQELRSRLALLTPASVRSHIARLPQDVDPVAVETVASTASLTRYARTG